MKSNRTLLTTELHEVARSITELLTEWTNCIYQSVPPCKSQCYPVVKNWDPILSKYVE
jgi:hypothetical protein